MGPGNRGAGGHRVCHRPGFSDLDWGCGNVKRREERRATKRGG